MAIKYEVKIIQANLNRHEFIYLVPLSDLHWDEPESDHDTIRGYVRWIKEHENAYTLLNGDLVTAPTATSAASVYEMSEPGGTIEFPSLDQCQTELVALFKPIRDRILGICSGGHEFTHLFRITGSDWVYNFAVRLGKQNVYARDGGALLIKTKRLTSKDNTVFSVVYTHGWGTARTRGAKLRKLEYLAQGLDADIYVISHDHTQNLARDNYLVPEWNKGWNVHRKLLVSTGAFRGYAGYPFRSGYQPSDLGTPRVRIGKRINEDGTVRKDIHASI
jgi:hypothetical protein